jgi:hypothetical protein
MTPVLRVLLVGFIVVTLAIVALGQIDYRITSRHLKIVWLGICLRSIPLNSIRYLSKRRSTLAENWWNTLFPRKRRLVIHRRTGLFKNFVITPKNRYIFKAQLERAIKDAGAGAIEQSEDTP